MDGEGEEYRKEEHLWNHNADGYPQQTGSRRPDITFEVARNIALRIRNNTVDVYADGRPKPREVTAGQGIEALAGDDVFVMAGKARRGTSDKDIRSEADRFCRDLAIQVRQKFETLGEFNRPPPAIPAEYPGTSSARKAAEKRAGKQ